jgi:hypothetical protein
MELEERIEEANRLREAAKRNRALAKMHRDEATRLSERAKGTDFYDPLIAMHTKAALTLENQANELDDLASQTEQGKIH